MTTGLLIIGRQHQAIFALDGQTQLQGIYAVEPQPGAKQGGVALDILRGQPLQIQAIDNQFV